jgi:hypothetical protein
LEEEIDRMEEEARKMEETALQLRGYASELEIEVRAFEQGLLEARSQADGRSKDADERHEEGLDNLLAVVPDEICQNRLSILIAHVD